MRLVADTDSDVKRITIETDGTWRENSALCDVALKLTAQFRMVSVPGQSSVRESDGHSDQQRQSMERYERILRLEQEKAAALELSQPMNGN